MTGVRMRDDGVGKDMREDLRAGRGLFDDVDGSTSIIGKNLVSQAGLKLSRSETSVELSLWGN